MEAQPHEERGRADAALVPAGLPRPGIQVLVTTRPVAWPLLIALRGRGDPMIAERGYAAVSADLLSELASRFGPRRDTNTAR